MSTLRFSVLLAAAAIAACSDGITGTDDHRGSGNDVSISPNPVVVTVGETVVLRAVTLDLRLLVIWTSDDPSVASVAPGGFLRGISPGATRIVARFGADSATAVVTVKAIAQH